MSNLNAFHSLFSAAVYASCLFVGLLLKCAVLVVDGPKIYIHSICTLNQNILKFQAPNL